MGVTIRELRQEDVPVAVRIASDGGSPDADAEYFQFVAGAGRMLVAIDGEVGEVGELIGVAGSIPLGDATMVTDLFVAAAHRGRGVGNRLAAAVTDGAWRRCTFSSDHPAALPAYARLGMVPRWRLLTMHGPGTGTDLEREPVVGADWRHDRADLVAYFAARGAEVGADLVVQRSDTTAVLRLVGDTPEADVERLLGSVAVSSTVELSVPEHDALVPWLTERRFEVVDADVFCATDGVQFDTGARCVHRGLC